MLVGVVYMVGRPGKYETHVKPRLIEIEAWARDGYFEKDIAKMLKINIDTFIQYKKQFSELLEALKNGWHADEMVERAAYNMAISEKYPIMTMWWLQNRRSNKWRNKQQEIADATGTEALDSFTKNIKQKASDDEKVEL